MSDKRFLVLGGFGQKVYQFTDFLLAQASHKHATRGKSRLQQTACPPVGGSPWVSGPRASLRRTSPCRFLGGVVIDCARCLFSLWLGVRKLRHVKVQLLTAQANCIHASVKGLRRQLAALQVHVPVHLGGRANLIVVA